MKNKIWFLLLPIGLLFIFWSNSNFNILKSSMPRNIILYIGDGMGLCCITAAKIVKGHLAMEELPHTGFVITFPADDKIITDSAASATALATGFKTDNAFIATRSHSNGNNHTELDTLKTVLEWAEEKGMSTGLVVTSSITHATPACFASHVNSRWDEVEIAKQMAFKNIEVLLGGGRKFFLPDSTAEGVRKDGLDLLDVFKSRGYAVVMKKEELYQLDLNQIRKIVGLFSNDALPVVSERTPTLSEMTQKALEVLKKDKDGFFLMVEGSQIDWRGHENAGQQLIEETIEFDNAITAGIEFASKNPCTLIVVTADHETGGCAIIDGALSEHSAEMAFSTTAHTAVMVPVFASGPGSDVFQGIIDNTFIGEKLIYYVRKRPQ